MSEGSEVRHFAYGANLASSVLARRRIVPRSVELATARGVRLVFDAEGILPLLEPAFANLVEDCADGAVAHGVVYSLGADDWTRLQHYENGYEAFEVDVEGGAPALAFKCSTRARISRPSRRYLALLVAGARERGLPATWIGELERVETFHLPVASPAIAGVFAAERAARGFWRALDRLRGRT